MLSEDPINCLLVSSKLYSLNVDDIKFHSWLQCLESCLLNLILGRGAGSCLQSLTVFSVNIFVVCRDSLDKQRHLSLYWSLLPCQRGLKCKQNVREKVRNGHKRVEWLSSISVLISQAQKESQDGSVLNFNIKHHQNSQH